MRWTSVHSYLNSAMVNIAASVKTDLSNVFLLTQFSYLLAYQNSSILHAIKHQAYKLVFAGAF